MSHSARGTALGRPSLAACLALACAAAVACFVAAPAMAAPPETTAPAADQPPEKSPDAEKSPPAEKSPESAAEPLKTPAGKTPKAEKPAAPPRKLTDEEIRELPILKRYEMPTEKFEAYLGDVKDHTFGYDEPAFYAIMAFINKLPPKLLVPAADDEDTPYSQLLAMPSSYRGQPVTIRGAYMLVTPWHVPVAALGKDVPRLFTVTLRELPLEKPMPVATVMVMEDPMTYLTVEDEVRVKGYFYKIRDYEGTKGKGEAPMILARRLEPVGGDTTGYIRGSRSTATLGQLISDPLFDLMVVAVVVMIVVFVYVRFRFRPVKKTYGKNKYPFPVHRFRLRRDDRHGPPGPTGAGSPDPSPKPQGGADH